MYKEKISELRKLIIELSYNSKEGHIASALSILDVLWVLYDKVLNTTPQNVNSEDRDIFILSKGHASLAQYVMLMEKGFISKSELMTFCEYASPFGGHPDRNKINGVEASTGSLGHGFPMATGMALAQSIKQSSSKTFVLIGDGECNEGTIWESALLAAHHNLSNLCCIVDFNHSTDRALSLGSLQDKFLSFGWNTSTINGHNHEQIFEALSATASNKPTLIIAETIKGYGCKRMENNPEWHHKFPSESELNEIINELT